MAQEIQLGDGEDALLQVEGQAVGGEEGAVMMPLQFTNIFILYVKLYIIQWGAVSNMYNTSQKSCICGQMFERCLWLPGCQSAQSLPFMN